MTEPSERILELPGRYSVSSEHSQIGFAARTMMITHVRGLFADFEGSARIGDDPADSSVSITIRTDSFTTNHERRDRHVKGADFLDVETYPEIRFHSTSVEPSGTAGYRVTGHLTVRDVTRSHTVDFVSTGVARDPSGAVLAGFTGTTTLDRREFGITANIALDTGGVILSNDIGLEFAIGATKER